MHDKCEVLDISSIIIAFFPNINVRMVNYIYCVTYQEGSTSCLRSWENQRQLLWTKLAVDCNSYRIHNQSGRSLRFSHSRDFPHNKAARRRICEFPSVQHKTIDQIHI